VSYLIAEGKASAELMSHMKVRLLTQFALDANVEPDHPINLLWYE